MSGHVNVTAQEQIDLISRGVPAEIAARAQADIVYVLNPGTGGAAGAVVLGTFIANTAGAGYAAGELISLTQTPPAAPIYTNINTSTVVTPVGTHLSPIGGGSTVTIGGVNGAIELSPVLYDVGATTDQKGHAWYRWDSSASTLLGVVGTAGTLIAGATNVRPLESTAATATTDKDTIEYQAVANGPWLLGSVEHITGGASVYRNAAGAVVTPVATRITSEAATNDYLTNAGVTISAIDTNAEALAVDPTANTTNVFSVNWRQAELIRWQLKLAQIQAGVFGATTDAASATGSFMARVSELLGRVGATTDAASATGSFMARVSELLGRVGATTDAAATDGTLSAKLRSIAETLLLAGGTVQKVTYNLIGGATNQTGYIKDRALYPTIADALLRTNAITIGTATGNATSLTIPETAATTNAELRTASADFVQHTIPATFNLPVAIGGAFTVTVTPSATATNTLYLTGDRVILTEVAAATGLSTKTAYATVTSVSTNAVSMTLTSGITGATFAANSELTGYTRLPNIPATAKAASVYVGLSPAKRAIGVGSTALQPVANLAITGYPLAYGGMQIDGGAPIDMNDRPAYAFTIGMILQLESKAAIDAFRITSAMPLSLLPYLEVTYS